MTEFRCTKCESDSDPFTSKTIDKTTIVEFRCGRDHLGTIHVSGNSGVSKIINVKLR